MNARVQQSKLASLGRLSASIAHEIRNPVGAMSHAAQLLRESHGLKEEDKRLTEIIQTHSGRVSHIIDNVLQLSRRESSRPTRFGLKSWLDDFASEFVRTLELQEGEFTIGNVPDDLGPAGQRREVAEPDIEARRFDDGDRRNSRDSSRVAVTRTWDEYRALM